MSVRLRVTSGYFDPHERMDVLAREGLCFAEEPSATYSFVFVVAVSEDWKVPKLHLETSTLKKLWAAWPDQLFL